MILATHQPIFLPWPGFFAKALAADCLVLLDDVQYPRGGTWLNRNRLKNEDGELWLTVPVRKTGRGLQTVREVELFEERPWRRKHLRSIRQSYAGAPYLDRLWDRLEAVYERRHRLLVEHNLDLIRLLWEEIAPSARLLLQSELGVTGRGTTLIAALARHLGASRYACLPGTDKHLAPELLQPAGVALAPVPYRPFVYPQLWGEFRYNLSTLDLLLDCGPKSRELIAAAMRPAG